MPRTVSVTEARNNFSALVRQVAGRDEPVVVTSRNQPLVVIVRWETYQHQRDLQVEGARHRLEALVTQMGQLASSMREAYAPDSLDLAQGTGELLALARRAWVVCRSLDRPRRHLASVLADGLLNLVDEGGKLTLEQIDRMLATLPLLVRGDLTTEEVAAADLALAEVGLDSVFPIGDESASHHRH